jgi:lipopolysaccharide export LptBFGC system permease protein LptF
MALVAFTLLMTILAIMEPLRKKGLATSEVASLFLYTLPVMLSLTLPFAALFAATIVYGRFAQDREMLACNASGISKIVLLKPAIVMGVIVTLVTLVLANFVSPSMARQAELTIVKNIRRIAYHKIKKEGSVELGKDALVHASQVDEKKNLLIGVVAGRQTEVEGPDGRLIPSMSLIIASSAYLDVEHDEELDDFYISVQLTDQHGPVANRLDGAKVTHERLPFEHIQIPKQSNDRPAFYEWSQLISTLKNPTQHGKIQTKLSDIVRKVRENRALNAIAATVNSGKPYKNLYKGDTQYVLSAHKVTVSGNTARLFSDKENPHSRVKLQILSGGMVEKEITADFGSVVARSDFLDQKSELKIPLSGNVVVSKAGVESRPASWDNAQGIPLPQDPMLPMTKTLDERQELFADIYSNPEAYTKDSIVLSKLEYLKKNQVPKIIGEIIAEMHSRVAFGLSCMLLVTLGAALGVIFKGGQVISAFAITVIPAAGIIIMILMGKQLIANPKASDLLGFIAIWGGIVVTGILNVGIFYRLGRK